MSKNVAAQQKPRAGGAGRMSGVENHRGATAGFSMADVSRFAAQLLPPAMTIASRSG